VNAHRNRGDRALWRDEEEFLAVGSPAGRRAAGLGHHHALPLVIDKNGGIYFTDPLGGPFRPVPAGRTTPIIFYIRPQDGKLVKVSEAVTNPNGITLSPDEKVLYAANGGTVAAFDVQPDGTLRNFRTLRRSSG